MFLGNTAPVEFSQENHRQRLYHLLRCICKEIANPDQEAILAEAGSVSDAGKWKELDPHHRNGRARFECEMCCSEYGLQLDGHSRS